MDSADPSTSSSLRVALVCPYSLSRPGGVQGQVLGLARALGVAGHRVTVFAPVDDPADRPADIDLVVTGHSVSLPANGSVAPVSISMAAAARALRTLESVGFDVVHIHEPFTPGLPLALLVGRRVPPLVVTFHRSGDSVLYRLLGPLARRSAARFALRTGVSEAAIATATQALGGVYQLGFNGIEVDRYRGVEPWPTDRPTVLFLGRHEERKGLEVLLDAFEGIRTGADHGGLGPVLWIAGDGPQTERLRRLHPAGPGIAWLGVLSEAEKVQRLVAADVLCAPSLGGESFGMVILEGLAARTPVIASDIDGYRAAAGGCAVLVRPGDPGALGRAVTGVLAGTLAVADGPGDPVGSRDRWLAAGAERADRWSMTRLAGWYEQQYRSVVVGARA